MDKFEKAFVSNRAGICIVDFLADELPLSKGAIKEAMQKGAVWLKRDEEEPYRVRRAKDMVKLRDEIHIYYDPEFLDIRLPPLRCLESQEAFSIWIKPEGILDEVSLYGDHLSLERLIERDMPKDMNCYLLDPAIGEITGLMLAVHTKMLASSIDTLLENNEINKDYQITVRGKINGDEQLQKDGSSFPLVLVKYNDYNKTSLLRLNTAQGIENDIMGLLEQAGFSPLETEQLQCVSIRFKHPVSGEEQVYSLYR